MLFLCGMTAECLSTFHTRLCIFINTFCTPKISEECEWLVLLYIQGYQMRKYYFRRVFKLPLPCMSYHLIDRECAIREQHRKVVGMDHPFLPASVRKAMMRTEVYLYACLRLIWWQRRDFLWPDVSIWYITVPVSCRFPVWLYRIIPLPVFTSFLDSPDVLYVSTIPSRHLCFWNDWQPWTFEIKWCYQSSWRKQRTARGIMPRRWWGYGLFEDMVS